MLKSAVILVIFVYLTNALAGGEHEHEYHEGEHHEEGYHAANEGYPAAVHNQGYHEDYEHGEHEHGEYEHGEHGEYEHGEHGEHGDYEHEGYNGYNQNTGNTGYNQHAGNTGYTNNGYGQQTNNASGHTLGRPVGNMVIHSPTTTGFTMVYDVSNPDRAGSFYFLVKEDISTGTPMKPQLNEIRMGIQAPGAVCGSRFQQVDDQMKIQNIPCTLRAGKHYTIWCETDKDSNGRDADYCNLGVGGSLSLDATGHGIVGGATTGTGTAPHITGGQAGHGTMPQQPTGHTGVPGQPGVVPQYHLVLGDHTCDFEEEAAMFVKMLPNTAPGDSDACAGAVSRDLDCGQTFYGGGIRGVCGCVRKTAEARQTLQGGLGKFVACDEEESKSGDGIYTFVTNKGILQSSNPMVNTEAETSSQSWFGMNDTMFIILTTYCFACCCLGSIYAAVQYRKKQNSVSNGEYAIYLDEENTHK